MSYQTISATPLEAVLIEARAGGVVSDVWLRKNIEKVEKDIADVGSESETAIEFYRADEIHFVQVGVPTVDEVTSSFDELWEAHANDGLTDSERIDELESQLKATNAALDDTNAALLEIGDIVGGEK